MDRFEEKDMKKIRPIKNTWYDWLINYILELMTKNVDGFKDKIVSLFNTQIVYGREKKLGKPKTQKRSEENKINSIRNSFILKKKKRKKRKL